MNAIRGMKNGSLNVFLAAGVPDPSPALPVWTCPVLVTCVHGRTHEPLHVAGSRTSAMTGYHTEPASHRASKSTFSPEKSEAASQLWNGPGVSGLTPAAPLRLALGEHGEGPQEGRRAPNWHPYVSAERGRTRIERWVLILGWSPL